MIIRVTDPCKPLDFPADVPLEVEVGCGKGRFLTGRAALHPDRRFLGIERIPERVRCFDAKCRRLGLANADVMRLEALYTFHYLLPCHGIDTVYVFFPDPWPKRKHHSHRLFGPRFLNALHYRLKTGGRLEFATDHAEYADVVEGCLAADGRFQSVEPMARGPEEWTEFETLFRGQGLPIRSAAWEALADPGERPLAPLAPAPEDEPREGVARRESHGKEWRLANAEGD
ncbi:MAG: hypothetical protein IKO72_02120 [Kiritimatiellae bacterium]|nr:hypothetical protein [Kiritimatiellia bacterium]